MYISFLKAVDQISQFTDRNYNSVQLSFLSMFNTKKAVRGKDYKLATGYGQANSKIYIVTRTLMADCINSMRGVGHEGMMKMHSLIWAIPESSLEEEVVRVLKTRGQEIPKEFELFEPRVEEKREPVKTATQSPARSVQDINLNIKIDVSGVIEVKGLPPESGQELTQALIKQVVDGAQVFLNRNTLESLADPDSDLAKSVRRVALIRHSNGE